VNILKGTKKEQVFGFEVCFNNPPKMTLEGINFENVINRDATNPIIKPYSSQEEN